MPDDTSRGGSAYDHRYPREQYQTTYLVAAIPPPSGDQFELGEQYIREALPLLRAQYAEDNYAIFVTECYLAFSLAKQDKWAEFNEPYQACKQGETKV